MTDLLEEWERVIFYSSIKCLQNMVEVTARTVFFQTGMPKGESGCHRCTNQDSRRSICYIALLNKFASSTEYQKKCHHTTCTRSLPRSASVAVETNKLHQVSAFFGAQVVEIPSLGYRGKVGVHVRALFECYLLNRQVRTVSFRSRLMFLVSVGQQANNR